VAGAQIWWPWVQIRWLGVETRHPTTVLARHGSGGDASYAAVPVRLAIEPAGLRTRTLLAARWWLAEAGPPTPFRGQRWLGTPIERLPFSSFVQEVCCFAFLRANKTCLITVV
jgi:hypothetical protein